MTDSLKHLSQRQHDFALQRGWTPLNSPRNQACALMVAAAELLDMRGGLPQTVPADDPAPVTQG